MSLHILFINQFTYLYPKCCPLQVPTHRVSPLILPSLYLRKGAPQPQVYPHPGALSLCMVKRILSH